MSLDRDCEEFLDALDDSTRRVYKMGLVAFRTFYKKPVSTFLDDVERDLSKPRRERKRIAVNTMKEFIEWLKSYNYAPKTIRTYVSAVQSLAKYFEIPISLRYVRVPSALPVNKKYPWNLDDITKFFSMMDKETLALASTLFQSGLSLRDALAITYGDIKDELENGETRICLDLVRIKTDTPHLTFIGEYATEKLKIYLRSRGKLSQTEPLFPISERTVRYRFRVIAKEMLKKIKERNPASPHSLRVAFRTLMRDAGAPEEYIEFWMGHNVSGDIRKIYTMHSREGWRKIYMKYEHAVTPKS
ncbi:MAG: tyrosine-type recombinase/integrase [Thermoproteota archaeon]